MLEFFCKEVRVLHLLVILSTLCFLCAKKTRMAVGQCLSSFCSTMPVGMVSHGGMVVHRYIPCNSGTCFQLRWQKRL